MTINLLPLGQKPLNEFTLEDFREQRVLGETYLGSDITGVKNNASMGSGHSISGILYFTGQGNGYGAVDRRLFAKQLLPTVDHSDTYKVGREPYVLYFRELQALKTVSVGVGTDLTFPFVAQDDTRLIFFQRYARAKSDADRLTEMTHPIARKRVAYAGHRSIACLNARLRTRKYCFHDSLLVDKFSVDKKSADIVDYFETWRLYSSDYSREEIVNLTANGMKKVLDELKLKNLESDVSILVGEGWKALEFLSEPGHGDMRAHHVIGPEETRADRPKQRKFIDWDRFGLYPNVLSHVTYSSMEGGLAEIPLDEICGLGGRVLAYDKAASNNDAKIRNRSLRNLDKMSHKKVIASVKSSLKNKFAVQYLALAIEDHMHLQSSSLRWPRNQLAGLISGIPGWSLEKMVNIRPQKIVEILDFVAQNKKLLNSMDDPVGARKYFARLGDKLVQAELVDVPETVLSRLK